MQDVIRQYEDKTVAVTGGRGYLGSALSQALRNTPARVLLVSRGGLVPLPGAESFEADIRTEECWREIVHRADIVFHLAGNTSVHAAAADPAESLRSTVLPLTHLAAAARAARQAPRVVYASTATVYGLTDTLPVAEETEPKPVTTYDLHKLFAEKQLELASDQGILGGISLRLANVYGPSSRPSSADDRGVLNQIATLALGGSDLPLYGDGHYLRDYVYIDDVVRAFLMAGVQDRMVGRSFNVGSGSGITVRDAFHLVAERAAKTAGKRSQVREIPWPEGTDQIEFRNFTAAIDRISSACGWSPTVSLIEGVDRLIDSLIAIAHIDGEPPDRAGTQHRHARLQ